jgi:hypothetical protein
MLVFFLIPSKGKGSCRPMSSIFIISESFLSSNFITFIPSTVGPGVTRPLFARRKPLRDARAREEEEEEEEEEGGRGGGRGGGREGGQPRRQ